MILLDSSHGAGDSSWRTNISDANLKFSLLDDKGSLITSFSDNNFVSLVNNATKSDKGNILLKRKLLALKLQKFQQYFKREDNVKSCLTGNLDIYFLHDATHIFYYNDKEKVKKHLSKHITDEDVVSATSFLKHIIQSAIVESTEFVKNIPKSKNFIFLDNCLEVGNFIIFKDKDYEQLLTITKNHIEKYYDTFYENYLYLDEKNNQINEILKILNKKEVSKNDLVDAIFKLYYDVGVNFEMFFH
tara:strand:+ start:51661 stop:52395 length:735 start_codon:yes stop_codon:yes gene_type:complete